MQRRKIIEQIPTYKKIRVETNLFQGILSAISPYDNFGSLISQIRSGASPIKYMEKNISLSYPKVDISQISSEYPLIGELREIVDEIENKDTRIQGINNYKMFFEKM